MAKRIIGFMVVGPDEKWLDQALRQRKELVDDMVICLNNSNMLETVKKHGFWYYEDNREWGVDQPRIKQDLLKRVAKLKPDWILASDADEMYDKYFTREEAEKLMENDVFGYNFAVVNLWDDEQHYNHTRSFWNVRFWNYKKAREVDLRWEMKNVHCGLAPKIVYKYAKDAPFLLKHYGLMYPEDRKAKVERYEKYDPNHRFKGTEYYDSINDKVKTNDLIRTFDEDEMHGRVVRDVNAQRS